MRKIVMTTLLLLGTVACKEHFEFKMVFVPGGTFEMGCTSEQSQCADYEYPAHTVTLGDFQISKYEITNQQYADFLNTIDADSSGSYKGRKYVDMADADCQIIYKKGRFHAASEKEDYPVIKVTWKGANAFCTHYGCRLPTEAEWEFAARGGNSSTGTKYAGSNKIHEVAWYEDNSGGHPHKTGTKTCNELGIYDMSGNVKEWCSDWFSRKYYESSPQVNPKGPASGSARVQRGGCWNYSATHCRVAKRNGGMPQHGYAIVGFRAVYDPQTDTAVARFF